MLGGGIASGVVFFDVIWPDIIQLGRVTLDVITGMSVTQSVRVNHIAILSSVHLSFSMGKIKVFLSFCAPFPSSPFNTKLHYTI